MCMHGCWGLIFPMNCTKTRLRLGWTAPSTGFSHNPCFLTGSLPISRQRWPRLWIHGAPGCRKTILCARIVEHLRSTLDPPPAHFFYSFDDQESRRDPFVAIRPWLTQVFSHPAAFELVMEEWESRNGQAASRPDVLTVFRKIVRAVPKLTFALDGLDECDGANQP